MKILAIAAAFSLLCSGPVLAQTGEQKEPKMEMKQGEMKEGEMNREKHAGTHKEMKKGKKRKMSGMVEAVDPAANKLTVKDGGHVMTFMVGPGTEIRKDGKKAALADLVPEDKVMVSYVGSMENALAVKIKAMKKKIKEGRPEGKTPGKPMEKY